MARERYLCIGGAESGQDPYSYARGASSPGWCHSQMPRDSAAWLALTSGQVRGHSCSAGSLTLPGELPSVRKMQRKRAGWVPHERTFQLS